MKFIPQTIIELTLVSYDSNGWEARAAYEYLCDRDIPIEVIIPDDWRKLKQLTMQKEAIVYALAKHVVDAHNTFFNLNENYVSGMQVDTSDNTIVVKPNLYFNLLAIRNVHQQDTVGVLIEGSVFEIPPYSEIIFNRVYQVICVRSMY